MAGYVAPPGWPEPVADWPAGPNHEAYQAIRHDLTQVLRAQPQAATVPVPACPGWTVHDVVAHLLRICEGRTDGPEIGYTGQPELTLPQLLDHWSDLAPEIDRAIEHGERPRSPMLIMDAFTHEIDILQALGLVVADREHPAWPIAFHVATLGFTSSVAAGGLGALRLETPGVAWEVGDGPPVAVVRAPHQMMLRSLTGRFGPEEISALDWSADPGPWLDSFYWGPFSPPPKTRDGRGDRNRLLDRA